MSPEEQEFLNTFLKDTRLLEAAQVLGLVKNCNNKFQFAKTHSEYIKDWEKTRQSIQDAIYYERLPAGITENMAEGMIVRGDWLIDKKLKMVRHFFREKFGESIYNYLGSDGKTRKFLGLFG